MNKNIRIVKLVTGDEFIGNLIGGQYSRDSISQHANQLEKPWRLIITPQGLGIIPLMETNEEILTLNLNHIVYTLVPTPEILEAYKERTQAIVTPDHSLVLPGG